MTVITTIQYYWYQLILDLNYTIMEELMQEDSENFDGKQDRNRENMYSADAYDSHEMYW